jgi:ABC-type phosphate transport system substrate-binding protein
MRKHLYAFLFLASSMVFAGVAKAQVIVVANSSVSADSVSKSELSDVFTGAASKLKDGSHVKPVLLKDGATHSEFVSSYVGKSPVAFLLTWRGLTLSGQAAMPRTFESEAALVEYVAHTPGAIGYVSKATPHEGVKVLAVQ